MVRVVVANRFGTAIAELPARVISVAWVLNGIGKATIECSAAEPLVTPDTIRPSNRVYLEFDNGLPPWGGVLDLPRVWSGGKVTLPAYTIEHLLRFRLTRRTAAFNGAPVGAAFARLLRDMEAAQPEGVTVGAVWHGGARHYLRYHYKPLWEVFKKLRALEGCDIVFTPLFVGGQISFQANLYDRAGSDKSNSVMLMEGANVVAPERFEEQGPIVNSVVAAGAGTTWAEERPVVRGRQADSIALYGLRERLEVHSGVTAKGTLEGHARRSVSNTAFPVHRFGLSVVDSEPGPFERYDIGDIVRLVLPSVRWGYDGLVRIIGREFRPEQGVCRLAVDEWHEDYLVKVEDERAGE